MSHQVAVALVVSLDDAEPARLDHQQVIRHAVEEVPVVADKNQRAFELCQGPLQGIARPEVEVIRRLVEDQQVRVESRQPGKRRAASLAATQAAHLLKHDIARQAKPRQQSTAARAR